ncbi:MAG: carboxymuconolactone decarboxylase family protein [Ruthenibacterium sp.]
MTQNTGKKLYSLGEAYRNLYHALRAFPRLKTAKKSGLLSDEAAERLMLAVTQVNGCAMCSYAHAQAALEAGMSADAIQAMLAGEMDDVPATELSAVLFAQHYADSRGRPSKSAWAELEKNIGATKSLAVLSAIQVIMAGNTYGIPLGSFKARFHADKNHAIDARSTLAYELMMLLSLIFLLPVAAIAAVLASLLHLPWMDDSANSK